MVPSARFRKGGQRGRRSELLRAALVSALALFSSGVRPAVADFDTSERVNPNLIDMRLSNFGSFAYGFQDGAGLFYPNGTDRTSVYAAGLWIAARMGGDLRVSVAEYSMTYGPGPILAQGQWADPEEDRYRTYKIVPGDSPESNPDYDEWPWEDGAPLGDDGYPRIIGDQTLWSVYNDLDPGLRTNHAATSQPLGIEVRQTTFADYELGPLERVVFLEWKILNKSGEFLEDAYISAWSDPDLGQATDDLAGCDSLLSMGYCYNGSNYDEIYEDMPPALGISLVQGPIVPSPGDNAYVSGRIVPGYRNLPMTAFVRYINGTDPDDPIEAYNTMQGLNGNGSTVFDPTTGRPTKFWFPGDPVTGQGWIDANPADRRMLVTSGPFEMAPGDSQTVAIAIVIGHGPDRLASITALKEHAVQAPGLFRTLIESPQPPPPPPHDLVWLWSPQPRWLTGVDAGLNTFFGGIGFGYEFFGSTLADSEYVEVKIRFDSAETTTCARYDRGQGYAWVGTGVFRGSAYDISDRAHPRRLNICFSEFSHLDGIWEPDTSAVGGREYLYVMNSDYNEGADYNDDNWGPGADVLYAAWTRVRIPYVFLETDPAELVIYFVSSTDVPEAYARSLATHPRLLSNLRAFPNPAAERVTLSFDLARPAPVSVSLIDATGRAIDTPISRRLFSPGAHRVEWVAPAGRRSPASGVYFWRIQAGTEIGTQRIVHVR